MITVQYFRAIGDPKPEEKSFFNEYEAMKCEENLDAEGSWYHRISPPSPRGKPARITSAAVLFIVSAAALLLAGRLWVNADATEHATNVWTGKEVVVCDKGSDGLRCGFDGAKNPHDAPCEDDKSRYCFVAIDH